MLNEPVRRWKQYLALPALAAAYVAGHPASAQTQPAPPQPRDSTGRKLSSNVYTQVEQMPQLPGGGGQAAVADALWQCYKYPAVDVQHHVEGLVFVKFTVNAAGWPEDIKIVKGLTSTIDAATVDAVNRLPAFTPGRQHNQPVKVSLTVPLTLRLPRR